MPTPKDSIFELTIQYTVNNQICMNVLHYSPEVDDAIDNPVGTATGLINRMGAGLGWQVYDKLRACMSNEAFISEVSAQMIWPVRWARRAQAKGDAGLINEPCTAQNVSVNIVKRGDLGARNNVGGMRVGAVPTGTYEGGEVKPGRKAVYQDLAEEIRKVHAFFAGINYRPVILNKEKYVEGGKERTRIIGWSQFTEADPMFTLRTMRRRTKGIGI